MHQEIKVIFRHVQNSYTDKKHLHYFQLLKSPSCSTNYNHDVADITTFLHFIIFLNSCRNEGFIVGYMKGLTALDMQIDSEQHSWTPLEILSRSWKRITTATAQAGIQRRMKASTTTKSDLLTLIFLGAISRWCWRTLLETFKITQNRDGGWNYQKQCDDRTVVSVRTNSAWINHVTQSISRDEIIIQESCQLWNVNVTGAKGPGKAKHYSRLLFGECDIVSNLPLRSAGIC